MSNKKVVIAIFLEVLGTWRIFFLGIAILLILCYILGIDQATWSVVWRVGIPKAAEVWAFVSFLYFLILLHQEKFYRDLKKKGIHNDGIS